MAGKALASLARTSPTGSRRAGFVGFFWGDDTDTARPDAWCHACEQALLAVPTGEAADEWFSSCDYKIFCAACWDGAKRVLYDEHPLRRRGDT